MTSKEYVEQVIDIGHKHYDIHFNDGVWWLKVAPFLYRPVDQMHLIEPGSARPKKHKALLGYSHLTSDKQYANKYWSMLFVSEERLNNFDMQSLSSSVRARVRKGLRLTEVKKIEDIEQTIDNMRDVCVSKASRTGHGKPPEYFNEEWKNAKFKEFEIDKNTKERWGAFYEGSLIAFMNIFLVDGIMFISFAASHTDHLNKCPNDALLFTILEHCKKLADCKKVQFGDWSNNESLNRFKQKYGFEREDLPVYSKSTFLYSMAKKIQAIIQEKRSNK